MFTELQTHTGKSPGNGALKGLNVSEQDHRFGGSWTQAKLSILHAYLKMYLMVLQKQPFTKFYIDGFAGSGSIATRSELPSSNLELFEQDEAESENQFLDGSAKVALSLEPRFDKYIFIETNRLRSSQLRALAISSNVQEADIRIETQNSNVVLENFCRQMRGRDRAVVFLDPYGLQVDWKTVEAIAETKKIDLWVLFSHSAVNRMLVRDRPIVDGWKEKLNRIFGTEEWEDQFYKRSGQMDFEMSDDVEKTAGMQDIADY